MRLLYLASVDFPHVKARAIQIVNTCHALARAGCDVNLVVGSRGNGSAREQLAAFGLEPHRGLRIRGLPTVRVPASAPLLFQSWYSHVWNWTYMAFCLLLLPLMLRAKPDAIILRDYRLAWLLTLLRRLHRRRLVFEVHGLPSAELLDQIGPSLDERARREVERRRDLEQTVFDGAWRLITITECLRGRLIRDYAITPDRVFTVPDASGAGGGRGPAAADEAHLQGQTRRTLEDGLRPLRPALRRLIYVGQLYPWKGVDLAIRALAEIPAAELTIVGGLPDDPHQASLERLAVDLGVGERIKFSGPLPYEAVPSVLAEAEVALLPLADGVVARCFTSPLKLFDYLAAGLPIVAVDFPTVREILRDEHNALLVTAGDPGAMAAAVNRLLEDPALSSRLAAQALLDAVDHTWDRRAERLLDSLLAETGTDPPAYPQLASLRRQPPSR